MRHVALVFYFAYPILSEKCYSCSSSLLHMRWPKNEETNKLEFLTTFPWFANESCDNVRNMIPVVDCPNSVCIKAVIKEPPAKRDVCIESGAVVRDCWSRVMGHAEGAFALKPETKNNQVRLAENTFNGKEIGVIYTCEGFLCNQSSLPNVYSIVYSVILFLLSQL